METVIERSITYDRWGSDYTITSRQERTIIYGEWEEV